MKYAHIEIGGKLLGFYDDKVHKVIPTPVVALSYDQWMDALVNGHNKINGDGTSSLYDFTTPEEAAAGRVVEIDRRLLAIDGESVRPLVAIAAGVQTTVDTDKLAALSTEAQALRVERAALYVAP